MTVRFIALVFLLVSGCSSLNTAYYEAHQLAQAVGVAPLSSVDRNDRWVIPRKARFYVAKNNVLADLSSDNSTLLTRLVEQSMRQHFGSVRQGLYPESLENSIRSAKMTGSQFVVYPKVLRWDDKLGTWTEIFYSLRNQSNSEIVEGFGLDRAAVQIIILDASSGAVVDFVHLEAGSGLFGLYGDRPESLIVPTLSDYFGQLALVKG